VERAKGKLALTGAAFLVGLVLSFWLNSLPAPAAQARQSAGAAGEEFDYRYRRVVCMSPAVAEIVFALGAGDRVVGVSQYTTYPPKATRLSNCATWHPSSPKRGVQALRWNWRPGQSCFVQRCDAGWHRCRLP
jgi:ABC-type hemin transport system substrate-binding protein